jgi:pimeloyl-ACP methyl ester carboxylesterase
LVRAGGFLDERFWQPTPTASLRQSASEPNWTDAQLKAINAEVLVADGDHDEAIKREHTEYIAATIPSAGLLILPNASHFAFLQDPELFNYAVLHFLGDR